MGLRLTSNHICTYCLCNVPPPFTGAGEPDVSKGAPHPKLQGGKPIEYVSVSPLDQSMQSIQRADGPAWLSFANSLHYAHAATGLLLFSAIHTPQPKYGDTFTLLLSKHVLLKSHGFMWNFQCSQSRAATVFTCKCISWVVLYEQNSTLGRYCT